MTHPAALRVGLVKNEHEDVQPVTHLLRCSFGDAFDLAVYSRVQQLLDRSDDRHDALLLDLTRSDTYSEDALAALGELAATMPTIVLTGAGSPIVSRAVRQGAHDSLITREVSSDSLARALRRAIERHGARHGVAPGSHSPAGRRSPATGSPGPLNPARLSEQDRNGLVARSPEMRQLVQQLAELAKADAGVLICGQPGSGKGRIARRLHEMSSRAAGPLITVHCADLSGTGSGDRHLGQRHGASSGAATDPGDCFEAAAGGAIFLDEVGDLPLEVQTRLLRVLEDRPVGRPDASRPIPVDVRVLAATRYDLAALVAAGSFRADLYSRLRIAQVEVPPLGGRRVDIAELSQRFVDEFARRHGKVAARIDPIAMGLLATYGWPGNVRELESVIETAVIRARGETIGVADLPPKVLPRPLEERREDRVFEALDAAGGNRTAAARALGVSRATLYRWLAQLD